MAQPSVTRIVNRALVLLGTADRITDIDDGTPLARAAEAIFDECRDEVLAAHPWNFAINRATLSVGADGDDEFAFVYALPANCLRWLPWEPGHPYYFVGRREGAGIVTNAAAPIRIRFVERVEDVARWSPGFAAALAGKLAMWMAGSAPVSSETSARKAAEIYETELRNGRKMDALEDSDTDQRRVDRSSWMGARESDGSAFGR